MCVCTQCIIFCIDIFRSWLSCPGWLRQSCERQTEKLTKTEHARTNQTRDIFLPMTRAQEKYKIQIIVRLGAFDLNGMLQLQMASNCLEDTKVFIIFLQSSYDYYCHFFCHSKSTNHFEYFKHSCPLLLSFAS